MPANPFTGASVLAALQAGHDAKAADHAAAEATKVGQLRGGTSLYVDAAGEVYGKCARVAYLRMLGLDLPLKDKSVREMFEAGLASETIVESLLARGLPAGFSVKTGDEIALPYTRADGTQVGLRPDALVVTADGAAALSLELKMVGSIWTALGVAFDLRPKSDHLIQAALYSLKRDRVPSVLLYSSRVEWHVSTAPKWLQAKFGAGHPRVEYKDNGTPLKIKPFNVAYDLTWRADGRLEYWTEGMDAPCPTVIDEAGLERAHDLVCQLRDTDTLGPRPSGASVDGSKSYNPCDYCPLAETCDRYEDNKAIWLDQVRLQLAKGE